MTITAVDDKMVRIECEKGIIDTRTEAVYSEVICKKRDQRFYAEVE